MRRLHSLAVLCVLACSTGSGCQSAGVAAAPKPSAPAGAAAAPRDAGGPPSPPPAGQPEITFSGGDGSSCEHAIVIKGAGGERAGIAAEYRWVRLHFPGYRRTQQDLVLCSNGPADLLALEDAGGHKASVYFDISDFLGKR